MRSSNRSRCQPVEFWNFEKPDYSVVQNTSYSINALRDRSIRENSTFRKKTKDRGCRNSSSLHDKNGHSKASLPKAGHSVPRALKQKKSDDKENADTSTNVRKLSRRVKQAVSDDEVAPVCSTTVRKRSLRSSMGEKEGRNTKVKPKLPQKKPKKNENIQERSSENKRKSTTIVNEAPKVQPEKTGKDGKMSQINKPVAVSEPNDSGVTDLDGSYIHFPASETRTIEMAAEISNIQRGSQLPVPKSLQQRSHNILPSLLRKNNSYSLNHKAPTFKGVLSSTALSECEISGINSSNLESDRDNSIFKIPVLLPKKGIKKGIVAEPSLDPIAEESVNDISSMPTDFTTHITPKKSSTLIRSRFLNLTGDLDGEGQSVTQDRQRILRSKQRIRTGDESKTVSGKDNNASKIDGLSSRQTTVLNESEVVRRSGRVRKKPLEFWNFETAEVKTLNNGEFSVVYNKQPDLSSTTRSSKCDTSKAKMCLAKHPALSRKDVKILKTRFQHLSVQESSACKRKMFSPESNTLDSTADFQDLPRKKSKKSLSRKSPNSTVSSEELIKFDDLQFLPWTTKDFTVYMGRSYCSSIHDVYAGFLFLKEGYITWSTTKHTTVCVISGSGSLKVLDSTSDGGTLICLDEKVKTVISSGKKLQIEKEGSDEFLKLFLVLQTE